MITPNQVTQDMIEAANGYVRANSGYPYIRVDPDIKFAAVVNAAIDAGLVVPANEEDVLRRALEIAVKFIATCDEEYMSEPQSWIDQARRELESEARGAEKGGE